MRRWRKTSKPEPPKRPTPPPEEPRGGNPSNFPAPIKFPDLQSVISGASIHSHSLSYDPQTVEVQDKGEGHHHNHHHIFRPTKDGHDTQGRAQVTAPKTLIVTLDSNNLEDALGAYSHFLKRRVGGSEAIDPLGLISSQIHELGELEESLDEETKMLLRKHVIYWKAALAVPKTKMKVKDTFIPSTATQDFYRPIKKCDRCNRKLGRFCCAKERRELNPELVTHHSLDEFLDQEEALERENSKESYTSKIQERRGKVFNPNAPAYEDFLMGKHKSKKASTAKKRHSNKREDEFRIGQRRVQSSSSINSINSSLSK